MILLHDSHLSGLPSQVVVHIERRGALMFTRRQYSHAQLGCDVGVLETLSTDPTSDARAIRKVKDPTRLRHLHGRTDRTLKALDVT
jgi:hypothetical protein